MGIARTILSGDKALNVDQQAIQGGKEFVGTGMIFEMLPEALNQVEIGGIRWEPADNHPGLKQAEKRLHLRTAMNRGIVPHQHQALGRIDRPEQMFQKIDQVLNGFAVLGQHRDLIAEPVVSAEQMLDFLSIIGSCRHAGLLSAFLPAGTQRAVQTYARLIQIE